MKTRGTVGRVMRIIIAFIAMVLHCTGSDSDSSSKTLHHVLLGGTVVLDCGRVKNTHEVKWFRDHKDSKSASQNQNRQIYHRNKQGQTFLNAFLKAPKRKVARNSSLVISDFRKEDVGVYHCQVCQSSSSCTTTISECILEKMTTQSKWLYAVRGDVYKHECPNAVEKTVEWTFQPLSGNGSKPYSQNSSLVLTNIQDHMAGNFTCWTVTQDGQRESALSLILCIISDTLDLGKSLQSCTLLCDSSYTEKSDPIVVVNDRANITVYHNTKKPNGSVDCIVTAKHEAYHKKDNKGSNTSVVFANSSEDITIADVSVTTRVNSTYSVNLATNSASHGAVKSVWISLTVCIGLCCLLVVLVVYHRRRATISNTGCCRDVCHVNSVLETEVLYTSVRVGRSDGSVLRSATECVYSDIKVQSELITH